MMADTDVGSNTVRIMQQFHRLMHGLTIVQNYLIGFAFTAPFILTLNADDPQSFVRYARQHPHVRLTAEEHFRNGTVRVVVSPWRIFILIISP